jgi:ABC-type multidrug transport system fused ATPase/permease subunit
MLESYRKLFAILSASERRRTGALLVVLLLVAVAETAGVASVMPFIAVLANPEVVETNKYLAWAYRTFGFTSRDDFLRVMGFVFLVVTVGSLSVRALGLWAQLRFVHNRGYVWSTRLMAAYLRHPYEWYLNRHTANLSTSILSEVNEVVNGGLMPALQICANALVAVLLVALLMSVDPILSLSVAIVLGGGFGLVQLAVRRRLSRLSKQRQATTRARFRIVQEAFGGAKDVKVLGLEESFVSRFREPASQLARVSIQSQLISKLPPFAMQGLLFGGMIVVLLYLMATYGNFAEIIPLAALYAFAGYRLLPAVQGISSNLSELRYREAALNSLKKELEEAPPVPEAGSERDRMEAMGLQNELQLRDVSYRYPSVDRPAIRSLSLSILANTTVAMVGPTGSGKSTTADVILGLLRPQSGALLVDGTEVTAATERAWRRTVGYVPQQIFLVDGTVAQNIAFGVPDSRIDRAAVERAAIIANLHDFVTRELPAGYDTAIGERGVRLSGGQRQRIGIARALYRDPSVLIMDEATSALDNLTEHAVMEAVHNLSRRKTIILIAHRLSTVRNCDCIFMLEDGKITGSGTYDELVEKHARFRAMAGVG